MSTRWRTIDSAPHDRDILVLCDKWAGEIHGERNVPGGFYYITSGGPTGSDYPGADWWTGDGDAYAVWIRPTHWRNIPLFKGDA